MFLNINKKKFIYSLLFTASLLTLFIFIIRFFNSISLFEIRHVLTSGYEEESLLEIWYNLKNGELYLNRLNFPYRWTLYNWLFYDFYSLIFIIPKYLFNLSYEWLPTYLRLLTLSGSILLFFNIFAIGKVLNESSKIKFYLTTILIFGLSFGYWNITVRPDIFSLLFETIAIFYFIKKRNNIDLKDLILIAFILYTAWSFKQTALIVFCAINLYFLLNLKIKKNIILCSIFSLLLIATVYFHNENYLNTLYFVGVTYPFDLNVFINNLIKLLSKNIILFSALSVILFEFIFFRNLFFNKNKLDNDNFFLFSGLGLSILYYLVVNINAGSSDNHTFLMLIFITLIIIKNEQIIFNNKIYSNIFQFSLVIYIFFCFLILSGNIGKLSPKKYLNLEKYKKCVEKIGKNTFVDYNYYRLPWNTKYNNPSVETFNYKYELLKGKLKNGGHEGLISKGFYNYLILFKNRDKLNLEKYEIIQNCNGAKIFKLKNLNNY